MSNILTGFNMQGNDPIDNRIVSPSKFETLEEYLQRVPIQKRYYGLSFYALDEDNKLRHYTFQTSLIEPTIDDDEEEIERLDKELQEHVNNKEIHKTSEEIRSEIVDADIPDTIARVQWTLDKIEEAVNTVMGDIVDGASDEYNTLKKIQDKIVELRTEVESQLYGDDGGEVLKTLEQALKFLNQYKDFIVDIPDNYVNKQDIVDNLNTDDPTKVLSARQGKVLSETLTNYFDSAMASIRAETNRAINAENRIETKLDKEIDRSIKEDQRIDAKLDAEIKRSTDEDLRIDSKLDAEIERSTNEDIRIDNKLDSEINRSTAEDDRLDQKIDAETTRATTAESNLNTKIETETDRAEGEESRIEAKLDNEITRSTNKDTEHDNRLQALEGQTHEQNTDLGTTNSTFQLKYNTGNKIKHESDAISVRNAADTDYVNFIAKNATFKGDLLVEGQSFVTETETVEIKDNLLLLNKGEVGAGVTKGIAGLEIDRGTEPNYFIIFDESDNRFKAGVEGDLWNLALRESDDNMLDGYFISWNSKDKILSTTNIVNESTPLLFGRTDYKQYSGNRTDPDGNYSSYAFISEAEGNHLYNFSGSSNWNIDTDKINFRFWKPLLGTTFKRASDNSEVLYHADIVNNLTSGGTNKVLSAEQGKLLQNSITSIQGSYLPLSGGTMTGSIIFPNQKGIFGRLTDGTSNIKIAVVNANNNVEIGNSNTPLMLVSNSTDLTHYRDNNTYKIWDASNLPTPANTTDLNNYLPLAGGNMTGRIRFPVGLGIVCEDVSGSAAYNVLRTWNSNGSTRMYVGTVNFPTYISSTASDLIHDRNGSSYLLWDSYNLTNPVTYTTNTYNHATLTNKDGQYFTYIKAGTNGLLPHSGATLTSGGSGSLGTSDQSFNAAYINNLHTNKITFGETGPYITGSTSATQFLNAEGGSQKVATGSLYVGPSYASDALNLVPANGIYSKGNIKTSGWLTFEDNEWTNTGWAYKEAKGSIKVLSVINETENKPTSYGSVLQFNSRYGYWCTQIWSDQTNAAGVIGTLRFRTTKNYASTEWNPWTAIATEDYVGSNYLPLTGGILTGQTTISTTTQTPLILNYAASGGTECYIRFNLNGTASGAVGTLSSKGTYLYNYSGNKYLFLKSDGVYFGTDSSDVRLATLTDLSGYLPLSGGILTGALTISLSSVAPIILNNTNASATEISQTLRIGGKSKGYFGYTTSTGVFMQNATSSIICVKDNGAYYGTSANTLTKLLTSADLSSYATQSWCNSKFAPLDRFNSSTGYTTIKITGQEFNFNSTSSEVYMNYRTPAGATALTKITWRAGGGADSTALCEGRWGNLYMNNALVATQSWVNSQGFLKSVSGYLPLSGGTMSGSITIPGGRGTLVITAKETSNYVRGISFTKGSTVNSAVFGYHSTGGDGTGSIVISPYPTSASPWDGNIGLFISKGSVKIDDVPLATQTWVSSQGFLKTTPSITISNSGSGNAVTAITARGHTLTVTKGATYLTSSSLSGYATQSWVTSQGYLTSSSLSGYATQTWVNNKNYAVRESDNVLISHSNEFNFTASSNTSIAINYRGGSGSNTSAAITEYRFYNGQGSYSNVNILANSFTGSLIGNASSATKLGSSTVGGTAKPIYLSSGTATACSATVGSSTVPVYMSAGTITQCSTTLGVSITGNAATATTATNSNNLGGYAAATYVKSTSTTKVQDIQVVTTAGSTTGVLYVVLES